MSAVLLSLLATSLMAQDPNSSDPKERRRAAEEMARKGAEAIPTLQKMLSDPDLDVRIEAVKSIVVIDTEKSLEPLVRATRDSDPEIQVRATDGLVNFYLPGYVRSGLSATLRRAGRQIKGKFTDTNDQVIDLYLEAKPEIVEALGKLARGGASMESRANAARAVGVLRGKSAVSDLIAAIKSTKDSQVMFECLIAFQKIRDRSAAPQLTFLLRDLDERVQVAAVETQGLLYNMDALPRLREVLARTDKKEVRRAALRSIAMLPDPPNRPVLQRYLQDKDDELREAAAEGLGRIGDTQDLPVLEKRFAEETKNSPRVSAAFALVMMGRTEMSEFSPLRYLVNTLNSSSRAMEARALLIEAARKPEVRRTLHDSMIRGSSDEKIYLAQVMAASGDSEQLPLLEQLSRDPDVKVAQEGLRALRVLKARVQ
ncbi:MAG TPA: HEAT repeat domain-containing protein [Bryobacteraceae bacterium]|nr:HEAT repeat domain-containing protein [Bryobacteraceae bacterium]